MSRKKQILNAAILLIAAYLTGFVGGLTFDLLQDAFATQSRHSSPSSWAVSSAEVMATANTYIVYTTLMFVVVTLLMTGIGIYFAKWFGVAKEREIKDNMHDFFSSLNDDSQLAKHFTKELFQHKTTSRLMEKILEARVEKENEMKSQDTAEPEPQDLSDSLGIGENNNEEK